MLRATPLRTLGVKTPEVHEHFGMAEEAAGKYRKDFLQGLKPIGYKCNTPGLKPRPPKETTFSADIAYPQKLIAAGSADADSFVIYAYGHLVIWLSPDSPVDLTAAGFRT